jgi:hypothetical protein
VPLGTLAVCAYAERGGGPAQGPNRLVAMNRPVLLAETTAQVDNRDVDAADVANQRDRLFARLALVDDEVAGQGLAYPQPDERVGVDDEAVWRLAQDRSILYP